MNYIIEREINKGFTLIELVIVIAIIGVMASVVVLSIGGQTGGAENAKDVGQAAQLKTVALLYAAGKGGSYEGLCDAKINSSPVFKALGDEEDTRRNKIRYCVDLEKGWAVIWKEKSGDNFSCIGEKANNVGFSATTGAEMETILGETCTVVVIENRNLDPFFQAVFFTP